MEQRKRHLIPCRFVLGVHRPNTKHPHPICDLRQEVLLGPARDSERGLEQAHVQLRWHMLLPRPAQWPVQHHAQRAAAQAAPAQGPGRDAAARDDTCVPVCDAQQSGPRWARLGVPQAYV